ncbi:MAG: hypothetical protein ABIP12_02210 [Terriglobales bacterium]
MDFTLKNISRAGIAEANAKAERYRFLNQPQESESICLDILAIEPNDQMSLRNLGLAITDQFVGKPTDRYADAEAAFAKLTNPYEKLYYTGIMLERQAKCQLRTGQLPHTLLVIFEDAMRAFEQAAAVRPPANDDAILHWNSCVRVLQSREDWRREHQDLEGIDAGDSTPM